VWQRRLHLVIIAVLILLRTATRCDESLSNANPRYSKGTSPLVGLLSIFLAASLKYPATCKGPGYFSEAARKMLSNPTSGDVPLLNGHHPFIPRSPSSRARLFPTGLHSNKQRVISLAHDCAALPAGDCEGTKDAQPPGEKKIRLSALSPPFLVSSTLVSLPPSPLHQHHTHAFEVSRIDS
jgi:hypothetical protein